MRKIIDEIERTRTYPNECELELIKEIKEIIAESDEQRLMEETASGDGNIDIEAFKDLV